MKAVLFDVGNTLLWLDHPFILDLLREHGVETTEDELLTAQYAGKLLLDEMVRTGRAGDDASRGRIFFAEVFRQLTRRSRQSRSGCTRGTPRRTCGVVCSRVRTTCCAS